MISEVVVASTAGSSVHGSGGIFVYDTVTGSSLHSFKGSSGIAGACSAVPSTREFGGIVTTPQSDKGVLNVYSWQKEQLHSKVILPQKLTAWCVSHDQLFCAGGTEDGRVFLWEISSGIMFASFDAHYRRINKLCFDEKTSVLVSISDDASLNVWLVSRLLDEDLQGQLPVPYCTFTDHMLPIKDVYVGLGAFPDARIYTSSLDKTVKVWSLASRSLISTIEFPTALSSLAVDKLERRLYVSFRNELYRADLHERQLSLRSGEADTQERLIKVARDTTVNTMTFSVSSNTLFVGCQDGLIDCYDVRSHQHLKSLGNGKNGVVDVHSILKPIDLGGVSSASAITANVTGSTAAAVSALPPILPFSTLKKTMGEHDRDEHGVQLRGGNTTINDDFFDSLWDDAAEEVVVREVKEAKADDNDARVQKLQEELSESKAALEKANKINEDMFAAVNKLKSKPADSTNKRQKK